jgi:hypothetical protein
MQICPTLGGYEPVSYSELARNKLCSRRNQFLTWRRPRIDKQYLHPRRIGLYGKPVPQLDGGWRLSAPRRTEGAAGCVGGASLVPSVRLPC